MFDVATIALLAAGALGAYFLHLVATKGLPAAIAWVKAKWNAGKAAAAGLQAGVESAHARITDLETSALPAIKARLSALEVTLGLSKPAPVANAAGAATGEPAAPAFLVQGGAAPIAAPAPGPV